MTRTQRFKLGLARLMGPFARIRRAEDGSATVEFVILFPIFMTVFLSSFEMGLLMTRHVMLERGLDHATRAIRLGTNIPGPVTAEQVKRMVCNGAGIIPNCMQDVKVEMRRLDPRVPLNGSSNIPRRADCVDRDDPAAPERGWETGTPHDLMILRVCALADPMFPNTRFGMSIATKNNEAYALVSTSAFVMEP